MILRPSTLISTTQCSCPVCGSNLADLGPAYMQEAHVKSCLEGGTGTSPQTAKYLVYKLPEESALIGTECKLNPFFYSPHTEPVRLGVICLEEFIQGNCGFQANETSSKTSTGSNVARLSCLCSFHNGMHHHLL